MKKFISLILIITLSLFALTACTSSVPTRSTRWDLTNGETLTYDIRLVNTLNYLTTDGEEISSVTADIDIIDPAVVDQIKPLSANGTYTTTIAQYGDSSKGIVTTELNLVEIYDISYFDQTTIASLTLKGMIDAAQSTDDSIAVITHISGECIFNNPSLSPVSSSKTVKGIYVGKERVVINDYIVTCEYNNNVCAVVFTDKVTSANSFNTSIKIKATEYFDNEMIFYVIRAYDSTETTEKMSINIVDPLISQSVVAISFQAQAYTTHFKNEQQMETSLYYVAAPTAFAFEFSLTANEQPLFIGGAPRATNKIVKIQQGYIVYTLSDADLQASFDSIAANQG
ncbi:MAG TPA: hypothetical protein P5087_04215 [Eubacteriales bacterium]|nr:hypothetical protein [Eubacteriales bacterium]